MKPIVLTLHWMRYSTSKDSKTKAKHDSCFLILESQVSKRQMAKGHLLLFPKLSDPLTKGVMHEKGSGGVREPPLEPVAPAPCHPGSQ